MKKTRRGFKLKSPLDVDPVARYEVPFMPDNMQDDSGLVAKANKNGTMIINKNIKPNDPIRKNAQSHEEHHLRDMMDGKLDYDDNAVYHNLDGKGVKKVDRKNFNESDKSLPWEKNAYKAGNNLEQKDMRPKPNKLTGPPNMYESDTPLSFVKQMGRKRRTADSDTVSMNEKFGPSMVKRFGPGAFEISNDTDISGNSDGDPPKSSYEGEQIRFDNKLNKFFATQTAGSTAQIGTGDTYEIKDGKFRGDLTADMQKGDNKTNYNQYLSSDMRNLQKAKEQFMKDQKPMSAQGATFSGKGPKGNQIKYIRTPDSPDFDPNLSTKENMMKQMFTAEYYDQDGTLKNSAKPLTLAEMNSVARGQIFNDNTAQKNKAFLESDTYGNFANKYKTIFRK
jgi:hypothetical protein